MNIKDNLYRYRQIDSSIYALWEHITGLSGANLTFEEIQKSIDNTSLYINSLNELKGITGAIPENIDNYKELIPIMKMYPKGNEIYLIKYIYANTDNIDGFSTYNILYELIRQSVIIMGDRPIFFITGKEVEELFTALKNNKFNIYKDCPNKKYHIYVKYPIDFANNEEKFIYQNIQKIK